MCALFGAVNILAQWSFQSHVLSVATTYLLDCSCVAESYDEFGEYGGQGRADYECLTWGRKVIPYSFVEK
jgi:hypothetical protein